MCDPDHHPSLTVMLSSTTLASAKILSLKTDLSRITPWPVARRTAASGRAPNYGSALDNEQRPGAPGRVLSALLRKSESESDIGCEGDTFFHFFEMGSGAKRRAGIRTGCEDVRGGGHEELEALPVDPDLELEGVTLWIGVELLEVGVCDSRLQEDWEVEGGGGW